MEIQRLADSNALARAAAELFVRLAKRAVAERGLFAVALSGGTTPRRVYERLSEPPLRDQVPWERVEWFWGDERPVPPEHSDSNYRMACDAMLASVPVTPDRIHRMQAEREDLEAAALHYEQELSRAFGVARGGPPPAFDLIFLGMGADGHTASLFPRTSALHANDRWVVVNPVPGAGIRRLTFTTLLLNRARCVCFLVSGTAKAATLAKVLEGPLLTDELPSQRVVPAAGCLIWMVDRAAAAELKGKMSGRPHHTPS